MTNVAIICGGFTSEFNISMESGRNIQANFPDRYRAYLVIIRKSGWTVLINDLEVTFNQMNMSFEYQDEITKIDFSIVYTHGDPGENGKLQAYFDMIDMPYVNSGPLASQLSFHKWYCNEFLRRFNFNVAESIFIKDRKQIPSRDEITAKLNLPIFIKPCDSGSSYGVSKVSDMKDFDEAIDKAFQEGQHVMIEKFLKGKEVTCGVYRNANGVVALPITEIVSKGEFFDHAAKYNGQCEEITPARISSEKTEEVQRITKAVYDLLDLRSIVRIDFIIVDDTPYVMELNTTPGFSDASIIPQQATYVGMTVKELWQDILEMELK